MMTSRASGCRLCPMDLYVDGVPVTATTNPFPMFDTVPDDGEDGHRQRQQPVAGKRLVQAKFSVPLGTFHLPFMRTVDYGTALVGEIPARQETEFFALIRHEAFGHKYRTDLLSSY